MCRTTSNGHLAGQSMQGTERDTLVSHCGFNGQTGHPVAVSGGCQLASQARTVCTAKCDDHTQSRADGEDLESQVCRSVSWAKAPPTRQSCAQRARLQLQGNAMRGGHCSVSCHGISCCGTPFSINQSHTVIGQTCAGNVHCVLTMCVVFLPLKWSMSGDINIWTVGPSKHCFRVIQFLLWDTESSSMV